MDDPGDGGGERYGEQHAEDAGHGGPRGDRHHDDGRVHLHGPALDHGRQHMPFQDLHGEHDGQHPQRDDEPPVGERDQHGDGPRDEGAQVGDVGPDEDERAEPDRTRHVEHEQPDGDADGVDEGDEGGPPHEPLHRLEGAPGHGLHDVPALPRNDGPQGSRGPVGVP
ncbi:hypothetical protein GCM10022233_44930 [Streptomyces shaanxiensis]|uniref:Uncharacterized protein n=1 Tax=Streptomyces shaanxiensis TaxID=653357 RepID=A0ABP7VEI7_9ACTN